MDSQHKRILRVGFSGVLAALMDLMVLVFWVDLLQMRLALAVFLAASSGAIASFRVNKFWAFGDASPITVAQVASLVGVALASALAVSVVLELLSVHCGLAYLLAEASGALLLFALRTYPLQSRAARAAHSRGCPKSQYTT